jgi:hypothetical protein
MGCEVECCGANEAVVVLIWQMFLLSRKNCSHLSDLSHPAGVKND